jgi:hypothetical protein
MKKCNTTTSVTTMLFDEYGWIVQKGELIRVTSVENNKKKSERRAREEGETTRGRCRGGKRGGREENTVYKNALSIHQFNESRASVVQ